MVGQLLSKLVLSLCLFLVEGGCYYLVYFGVPFVVSLLLDGTNQYFDGNGGQLVSCNHICVILKMTSLVKIEIIHPLPLKQGYQTSSDRLIPFRTIHEKGQSYIHYTQNNYFIHNQNFLYLFIKSMSIGHSHTLT